MIDARNEDELRSARPIYIPAGYRVKSSTNFGTGEKGRGDKRLQDLPSRPVVVHEHARIRD